MFLHTQWFVMEKLHFQTEGFWVNLAQLKHSLTSAYKEKNKIGKNIQIVKRNTHSMFFPMEHWIIPCRKGEIKH